MAVLVVVAAVVVVAVLSSRSGDVMVIVIGWLDQPSEDFGRRAAFGYFILWLLGQAWGRLRVRDGFRA